MSGERGRGMALPKLAFRGTYEDINGGAHRTAASIVGIPALVRNLGIWDVRRDKGKGAAGDSIVDGPAKTEAARNESRRRDYRTYIRKLKKRICKRKGHLAAEPGGLRQSTYDQADSGAATLLRFRWHGMLTTVRLEYHTEYITLTSIIDLSIAALAQCHCELPDCAHHCVKGQITAFKERFEHPQPDRPKEHKAISDYLQLEIWDKFEKQVIDGTADGRPILGGKFGEVFLDSRGIVTGTRSLGSSSEAQGKSGEGEHQSQAAFAWPRPRGRMRTGMRHGAPERRWPTDSARRLWPFIECEPKLADFEYTVTGFLDGRVLFVTALGPQPVRKPNRAGKGTDGEPIRYFLHARSDDEWELGRLVDRINALGTMRLAATMEIGALRVAGGDMDDLAEKIESAAEKIQAALKAKSGERSENKTGSAVEPSAAKEAPAAVERAIGLESSAPIEQAAEQEALSTVRQATEEMAAIRQGYQGISADLATDIWHRLERSQYYFEQFQKECSGLREKRVEGFQTYSEFVTRRMNSIFGYIAYLKTRIESIDSNNSSLERQFASLKIASVTENIQEVVERLTEQDSEIAKIQEFGEFALIGALIPYYVGNVIEHTFELDEKNMRLSWVIVITICIFICLLRLRLQRSKIEASNEKEEIKQDARSRLGWVEIIFVVYLAVVVTVSLMAIIHQPINLIGLAETATLLDVFVASLIVAAVVDLYAIPALAGHFGGDSGGGVSAAGTELAARKPAAGADGGT